MELDGDVVVWAARTWCSCLHEGQPSQRNVNSNKQKQNTNNTASFSLWGNLPSDYELNVYKLFSVW